MLLLGTASSLPPTSGDLTAKGRLMSDKDDATLDLYVAAYSEPGTAEEDWSTLKALAADDVITVGALALVNRDSEESSTSRTPRTNPASGRWSAPSVVRWSA